MEVQRTVSDIRTIIHTIQEVIEDDEGLDAVVEAQLYIIVSALETKTASTAEEVSTLQRLVTEAIGAKLKFNPEYVTKSFFDLANNIISHSTSREAYVEYKSESEPEPELMPDLSTPLNLEKVYPKPPRDVRCCCMAAVREPIGSSMDDEHCTHFVRQCRRKRRALSKTPDVPNTEPPESTGLFCRQHSCFPPLLAYADVDTSADQFPIVLSEPSRVIIWGKQCSAVQEPQEKQLSSGHFLQDLDDVFISTRTEIRQLHQRNQSHLYRFKQNVMENVQGNMDLLLALVREKTDIPGVIENELCGD